MRDEHERGALREIPFMGVIHVVAEAMKLGFYNGNPEWSNLGQGQPEVGEMDGAPPRIATLALTPSEHAYGPIGGTNELREAIAAHYNRLYRQGRSSRYGPANVSVAAGGRLVLSRVFAALDAINLGYQIPDYTAYEDMIGYHRHRLTPIPVMASEADGFRIPPERFLREVEQSGLSAFVLSNPCNPTGAVIAGPELAAWVEVARRRACTLVLDEFYSHFIYGPEGRGPAEGPVSAAAFVEEVDRDPVLLVDGLTKSFRYPGWRIGWAVGPAAMIESLDRAASAIDGGPPQPMQHLALQALEPARADQETAAVRRVFAAKRDVMVASLRRMGVEIVPDPRATFYAWGSVRRLPAPLDDAEAFFRAALDRKVMTVPGVFFDVNPGRCRRGDSPFRQWLRFSFGPPMDNLVQGLQRLEAMVAEAR